MGAAEIMAARVAGRFSTPIALGRTAGRPHVTVLADPRESDDAIAVTNEAAFRSFVLTFLEHAEILEPEELRASMRDWLVQVIESRAS